MKSRRTFPLKTAIGSRDALTYYGHLVGQAEAELGEEACRMASFALTWIAGDGASRGDKTHSIDVDGLMNADQDLGNWSLSLRVIRAPYQPIQLYRQQFLAQDGKELVSLAVPFLEGEGTENLDVFCLLQLARHCTKVGQTRGRYILRDSQGHEIRIELKQRTGLPQLSLQPQSVRSLARRIIHVFKR